jgi:hypothetical protein
MGIGEVGMLKNKLSYIIILAIAISGCANDHQNIPDIPNIGIDSSLLNKDLIIQFFPSVNSFKIGDDITLVAILVTHNMKIRVKNNLHTRIFVLDDTNEQWTEVKNKKKYIDQDYFVLDDTGFPFLVTPDLKENGKSLTLLITITGDIMDGDLVTSHITGAYKVVTLNP